MSWTHFKEVKVQGVRYVVVDGKRKRQQKTFTHTINPFNKNADGSVKTHGEVLSDVCAERDAWVLAAIEAAAQVTP